MYDGVRVLITVVPGFLFDDIAHVVYAVGYGSGVCCSELSERFAYGDAQRVL